MQELLTTLIDHSEATETPVEDYLDGGIYIAYDGHIDPQWVKNNWVMTSGKHFSLTSLGMQKAQEPLADWDGFNAYMLTDPMFKGYRDVVRPIDGDLNSYLSDAYGLVAANGVGAFALVWNQWVNVSDIDSDDRETIAQAAEGCHLPADFVATIRGT